MTPTARVTLFFFAQSLSVALMNGFGGIWLRAQGFDATQIGFINAAPVAVLMALSLWVGRLADRASDWRVVIIWGAWASAALPVGLIWAEGFATIALVWTAAVVAQWAVVPVADAAALRFGARHGLSLGRFRAAGTAGYLLILGGAGLVLDRLGIAAFLPVLLGLCLLRALAALTLPRLRDQRAATTDTANADVANAAPAPVPDQPGPPALKDLRGLWFLLPVAGWALLYATHLVLNGFQGLLWAEQGIAARTIGLLIALGALAEVGVFLAFGRIAARVPLVWLLGVAGTAAVLRWLILAGATALPVLVGAQLLHGLSYALGFLACTQFIATHTREAVAARAQAGLAVTEQAFAIVLLLAFGWVASGAGSGAYLGLAGVAALALALIVAGGLAGRAEAA